MQTVKNFINENADMIDKLQNSIYPMYSQPSLKVAAGVGVIAGIALTAATLTFINYKKSSKRYPSHPDDSTQKAKQKNLLLLPAKRKTFNLKETAQLLHRINFMKKLSLFLSIFLLSAISPQTASGQQNAIAEVFTTYNAATKSGLVTTCEKALANCQKLINAPNHLTLESEVLQSVVSDYIACYKLGYKDALITGIVGGVLLTVGTYLAINHYKGSKNTDDVQPTQTAQSADAQ